MAWRNRPREMHNVLDHSLPGKVAGKLPPPGLASAWRALVGPILAPRARVVCLEPDGTLVLAVAGAAFQQELAMAAPSLAAQLRGEGFAVKTMRFVKARAQAAPPPPPPPPPPLSDADRAKLEQMVEGVRDSQVRQALLQAMAAQFRADPDPDR